MDGKNDKGYIPLREAIKYHNDLHPSYANRLAQLSRESGNPFPVKRSEVEGSEPQYNEPWIATLEQWGRIFSPPNKQMRKSRETDQKIEDVQLLPAHTVTCKEAAALKGIAYSWALEIGKRAVEKGYAWPKRERRRWQAPKEEWFKLFEDGSLKSWEKKK